MSACAPSKLLYAFSRKLAGVGTLDDVLWATAYQIALMLKVRVVLLLPENGSIAVKAGYPPEDTLDEADLAAAKWAWENDRPAGRGSDTLPGAKRLFLPMRTGRGAIGVIGIDSDKPGPLLTPEQRRLLDALMDQSALAIERVHLVEDLDRAKRAAETDRLRSALLTSISHDLKTPLAAVLGAAGTLRDLSSALTRRRKADLLATIIDESERLNRFIANLLDMTRLESGAVAPNAAPHDVGEIVGSALAPRRQDPGAAPCGVGARARAANAGDRCGAVRAGAVQYPGQCGEVCSAGTTIRIQSWRDGGLRLPAGAGRGRRHSAPTTWSVSSTSSIGRKRAIRCARVPDWGWPSHAVSSKPCTARSRRQPHRPDRAPRSRSGCRYRRQTEQLDTAA